VGWVCNDMIKFSRWS